MNFPEVKVFWEDLKFVLHHLNDIERFAAVGDKSWEKWWVEIIGSLVQPRTKFFDISQEEEALELGKRQNSPNRLTNNKQGTT